MVHNWMFIEAPLAGSAGWMGRGYMYLQQSVSFAAFLKHFGRQSWRWKAESSERREAFERRCGSRSDEAKPPHVATTALEGFASKRSLRAHRGTAPRLSASSLRGAPLTPSEFEVAMTDA